MGEVILGYETDPQILEVANSHIIFYVPTYL